MRNSVNKLIVNYAGRSFAQRYSYAETTYNSNSSSYQKDNLPTAYVLSGSRYVTYDYDGLNRLTKRKYLINVIEGTNEFLTTTYTYRAATARNTGDETRYTTTQLATENIAGTAYAYTYGTRGNITRIDKAGSLYRKYTYDAMGQLLSETNASGVKTQYTYDDKGNILSSSSPSKSITYTYGTQTGIGWKNLLTKVNIDGEDEAIVYDVIGNPTTYRDSTVTWNGRRLKTYKKGDITYTNTYDANGLRTEKKYTQNGITYTTKYYYAGDSLAYQVLTETDSNDNTTIKKELYFFYDSYGNLTLIKYYKNGSLTNYPVLTNSQGDVVAIYSASGELKASYEYDAWGNATITDDSTYKIGTLNPIRYRGYYYDNDLELYYLQSRYYDAEIGRFLNSDSFTDSNAGILGYNTFIYCANNPVNSYDPSGHSVILTILGKALVGGLVGAAIGAGLNIVGQLKRNGGDFSKIDKKELGIAAAVGGITGALSGGFGAAIAKAAGSIVAKTVSSIVTEGVINAVGGTCSDILTGTERTMLDNIKDFSNGVAVSAATTGLSVFSNHSRFSRATKSQKRAMLNNNFTNREIKAGVYNTPEYNNFLLEGSDELASCFDVAVKLFEEYVYG